MSAAQGVAGGFAIAGAIIGSFTPAGPWAGFAIGMAVGSMVGNAIFPPKVPESHGPRLNDRTIQTSTDLIETAHTQTVSSGGKGGAPRQKQTTYTYSISCAIALCEGPIIGIRKIWAERELFYDLSNPSAGINFPIRVYTGSETQTADPAIEADKGAGNVPAFRGPRLCRLRQSATGEVGQSSPEF